MKRLDDYSKLQEEQNIKLFLFGRWISICYAETHLNFSGKTEMDFGFDRTNNLSVLNMTDGNWWKQKIKHFNEEVYPNFIKSGAVKDAKKLFEE